MAAQAAFILGDIMPLPFDYQYHMTYQEIADELGISRQRVKQIEEAALRKLRDRLALHQHYVDHINSNSRSYDLDSFLSS